MSAHAWMLDPGDRIRRTALHRDYGGSNYGGMAPSATTPNVLLFTDPRVGQRHGYFDGWVGDVFHYTGWGQRGDQEFKQGNRAVRDHAAEGRTLRLFHGVGGTVTYLGSFGLDAEAPWYQTDAPETGGGPVRQVIVFRLVPVGLVVHDAADILQTPDAIAPAEVDASLTNHLAAKKVDVPIENQFTERVVVDPSREPYEAERREQKLVLAYRDHLLARGSAVSRHRLYPKGEAKPLFSDVYDATRHNLIEAKGTGTRGEIRMAIGQLIDYQRFFEDAPACAVLLPNRPRLDLEALLTSAGIRCIWRQGAGFADNADGAFI